MSRYVDLDERVTAQFYDEECEEWTMQTCTIADVLDSVCDEYTVLPPAQPERKKGRWSGSCCSVCGVSKYNFIKMLHIDDGYRGTWNYCPNCGADMRKEEISE